MPGVWRRDGLVLQWSRHGAVGVGRPAGAAVPGHLAAGLHAGDAGRRGGALMKIYRLVGVETQDVPRLEVQASCERVAVARLCKMLVQHHCREKGLPYYTCGCTMIGDAGAHAL